MSSTPIGTYTIPQPPEDTYPADLPAGLEPTTSGATNSSSSGSSSSSTTSTSATQPAQNPYLQAYATLQSMDTQELMNVTFGSQDNANQNILSVLSQWAAIQAQEQATQEQAMQNQISSLGTTSSSSSTIDNVPSLDSIISQSDQAANNALQQYASAPAGSSIIDYQA